MSDAQVTLERRGSIAVVTLCRPEKKNALGPALWAGIARVTDELAANLPRAVVITGAGSAFCAGMDVSPGNPQISHLVAAVQARDRAPMKELLLRLRPIIDNFVALPVPTIAAVNGLAYGGGAEIATRCDLRVLDPEAVICFSEVRLGLMPDMGGGVALTRLLGPARAADLILTARRVGAEEALALGLANRVSAPGKVLDEALELADQIATNGPRATRAALAVIRRANDLSEADALDLELEVAATLMGSGECGYGIAAFAARKTPEFPDPD